LLLFHLLLDLLFQSGFQSVFIGLSGTHPLTLPKILPKRQTQALLLVR
jgi:hypothetical protein